MWRDEYIKLSKEDFRNSTQWKRPLPGRPTYQDRPFTRFLGDAWIPKLKACNTWTEWLTLTKEFEHAWHVMLNLKPPESSCACDAPVERSKRPRDDSDPWSVAWPSDTHRRLEVLGDNKVVINWMNGAWEVKNEEHAIPVRVWWTNLCGGSWVVLSGQELMKMTGVGISFASQTKLRTHMLIGRWTTVILDPERNGWRLIFTIKYKNHIILCCLFDGARRESGLAAAAWILWLRNEYGIFEKVSYGCCVLRNASAMIAEREALRKGIGRLTVLFPTVVSSFDFQV